MAPQSKVQIITFYSFKGGVGRTMALANAAIQLANRHGRHVIAVDWDLEAPGLHYYFGFKDDDLRDRPGLLDYLEDFAGEVAKGEDGEEPGIERYLTELKPELQEKIRFGSVKLMTCGRTDDTYMHRVQGFDWPAFYAEQQGFQIIETLKERLRQACDTALIDARTGQADIGTTPTIQMPDAVVLLFTSNRQSLHGTAGIARRLKHHPDRTAQGFPDLRLLMVPSRVFPQEDRFDTWFREIAQPVYDTLLSEAVLNREDQPQGLAQCIIPVDPRFTFDEALPILEDATLTGPLQQAYANLASALDNLCNGLPPWVESVLPLSDYDKQEPKLRDDLKNSALRGDVDSVSKLQMELASILIRYWKYQEAESLLHSARAYYLSTGNMFDARAATTLLATASIMQGDFVSAQSHIEWLQSDLEKNEGSVISVLAKYLKSVVHYYCERYDDASAEIEEMIEMKNRINMKTPLIHAYTIDAKINIMKGNIAKAWRIAEHACQMAEKDRQESLAPVLIVAGTVERLLGNVKDAEAYITRALSIPPAGPNEASPISARLELAKLKVESGKIPDALETISQEEENIKNWGDALEKKELAKSLQELRAMLANRGVNLPNDRESSTH